MYNRMLDVMEEMLTEVFNDLIAAEDLNANYWFQTVSHQFNWNNAIHYITLGGLEKANEYIEDNIANPILSAIVSEHNEILKDGSKFNKNTCNE